MVRPTAEFLKWRSQIILTKKLFQKRAFESHPCYEIHKRPKQINSLTHWIILVKGRSEKKI
jgi:hypothetical protein